MKEAFSDKMYHAQATALAILSLLDSLFTSCAALVKYLYISTQLLLLGRS